MIYGPLKYGGHQLLDLRVEQPVMHVSTTLGHMHRGGNIGKVLYTTLRDIQIEIGTEVPFYNLDPEKYGYCTQYTRWQYFWKTMKQFKINVEIFNM